MRKLALIAVFSLLAACKKDIQNKEAVKAGIDEYLKASQATLGLNMDMMQVEITSLTFSSDGSQAQAVANFTARQGGGGMSFPYTLDRKENKWVVRPHAQGANPHGGVTPGGENPHDGTGMPPLPSLPDKQPGKQ